MEPMIFGETESNFGLMIRDRNNHDNYVLIDFDHLDIIFERYQILKQTMGNKQKKGRKK